MNLESIHDKCVTLATFQKQKTSPDATKIHKEFHSTPELCWDQIDGQEMTNRTLTEAEADASTGGGSSTSDWRKSQSQEDVFGMVQTQVCTTQVKKSLTIILSQT